MRFEDLPKPFIEAIARENSARREPIGRYHVTEALGCLVKAHLTRLAMETRRFDDDSVRGLSWFLFRGQLFHQAIQPLMGGGVPLELSWPDARGDPITLVGEADWLEETDEGEQLFGELKTCKNRYWYAKNGVGPEHQKQVAAYLYMLNKSLETDTVVGDDFALNNETLILGAAFYYLDMEGVTRLPLYYEKKDLEGTMAILKKRVELLHEGLATKTLPDNRVNWRESWECNPAYCPFTEFCHPEYPFEAPAEYPKLEKWFAGPMKVKKTDIENNLVEPDSVRAILEESGVVCEWK